VAWGCAGRAVAAPARGVRRRLWADERLHKGPHAPNPQQVGLASGRFGPLARPGHGIVRGAWHVDEQDPTLTRRVVLTGSLLFCWWLATVLPMRLAEMSSDRATTTVHMRYQNTLPFPAITVCNMATEVPLHKVWCGTYLTNSSSHCEATVPPGKPNCLTFNNNLNGSVFTARKTGLADTLMIALRINRKEYPPSTRFVGAHISLHPQCSHGEGGTCPEELSNVLLASPGQPRFFRMRRITLEYLNGTFETQFEARDTDSSVADFEGFVGSAWDTVLMGFHYSSLAETLITELPAYSVAQLAAELGGIIGLLFGFGGIDIIIHMVRWCGGRGSFYHDLTGRHPSRFTEPSSSKEERPAEGGKPSALLRVRGGTVPRRCGWMDHLCASCCPRQCYASQEDAWEFLDSERKLPSADPSSVPRVPGRDADVLLAGRGAERAGWFALFCCCWWLPVEEYEAAPALSSKGEPSASPSREPPTGSGESFKPSDWSTHGSVRGDEDGMFDFEEQVERPLLRTPHETAE
jgi:hypothetical protein